MTKKQLKKLKNTFNRVYLVTLERKCTDSTIQELVFSMVEKPLTHEGIVDMLNHWRPMWEVVHSEEISWGEAELFDIWKDDKVLKICDENTNQ